MATTITIPSFDWTAFYYPEILEALLAFKRINVPEHTDESPQDPLIQALRAFACVGHLNSVNTDVVANESTLPTAKLPETIRNMLRLIGYELASAAPAIVDVVMKLTAPLTESTTVVAAFAQISTKRTATEQAITFEVLEALVSPASDDGSIGEVLAYDKSAATYTDYTAQANGTGGAFTPWAAPADGDCLYIGHEAVMFDQLGIELDTAGAGLTGIWEYYDGDFIDGKPTSVNVESNTLRISVNSILGIVDRHGTLVRVQIDKTGAWEEAESIWNAGQNQIVTTSLLGQQYETVSEIAQEYSVGRVWKELASVDDGSTDLTESGAVVFTLPENLTEKWIEGEVNGDSLYWLRYRIITASTPTAPIISGMRIDEGGQYVKVVGVQGTRQSDSNLGIADGVTAAQEFTTTKDGFIDESETVTVDSVAWSRVDNFLQSSPTDRNYQIVLGANDRATILFGNGINGAIPSGQVAAVYRYGVTDNGNVGAATITIDRSGLVSIANLWNPRPAVGWQEAQAASAGSLEMAKVLGPASLRTAGQVALGPEDVEAMTIAYVDPGNNTRPFVRAHAVEEGYGPKTIKNVVVPSGGGVAPEETLTALDSYFNGDPTANPPLRKRLVANQEMTSANYTPVTINVAATVYGAANLDVIEDVLRALFQPDARRDDGVTFQWEYGANIFPSRVHYEIHRADSGVWEVSDLLLNGSSAALDLQADELPVAGTIVLTAGV